MLPSNQKQNLIGGTVFWRWTIAAAVFILLLGIALSGGFSNAGEAVAKILWSGACGFAVYTIQKTRKFYHVRYLLFVGLALGAFGAIHFTVFNTVVEWTDQTIKTVESSIPICHISVVGILGTIVSNEISAMIHGPWTRWGGYYLPALGWLVFTLTLGTAWCSWACWFGAWDESASRIAQKRTILPLTSQSGKWRHVGTGVLLGVILIAFVTREAFFCHTLCPFKLTGVFWNPAGFYRWVQITAMSVVGIGTVVLLPALTGKRIFCTYICPFGAWQRLVGKIHPYRIKCNIQRCIQCGKCQEECPMQAISKKSGQGMEIHAQCNYCGKCLEQCPSQAMVLSWRHSFNQNTVQRHDLVWLTFVLCGVIINGVVGLAVWGQWGKALAGF